MPEQLNHSPVNQPEQVEPQTFQEALEHPDMHPALRPHVERLAAAEAVTDESPQSTDLDEWFDGAVQNLDPQPEAEAAVEKTQGKEQDPWSSISALTEKLREHRESLENTADATAFRGADIYALVDQNMVGEVIEALEEGKYSTKELAAFLHESRKLIDANHSKYLEAYAKHHQPEATSDDLDPVSYRPTRQLLSVIPPDKMRDLYFSQDASVSEDLRLLLTDSNIRPTVLHDTLPLLAQIYGCNSWLDLMDPEGSVIQHDALVDELAGYELIGPTLLDELIGDRPEPPSPEDESYQKMNYADQYLKVLGLSESLRDDLLYASHSRVQNKETGYVDTLALYTLLSKTEHNVRKLGIDDIERLREKAGIVNLDYYDKNQLWLMIDVVNGHEKTIQHLQAGDVTVVLSDARGDHNGALRTNAEEFATQNHRTLFFEINQPSDFYRHMLLLKQAGIKPSTLVLAAHGQPGAIVFGASGSEKDFYLTNLDPTSEDEEVAKEEERGPSGIAMTAAKGIPRIVDEMMQDSRGIDDNMEARHRRRIILKSCSQAKPQYVKRRVVDRNGDEFIELRDESSAETLIQAIGRDDVDLYAGAEPLSFQRTRNGIGMNEHVDTLNGQEIRPLPVTHLRLDHFGNVIEEQIDEVVLRRTTGEQNAA